MTPAELPALQMEPPVRACAPGAAVDGRRALARGVLRSGPWGHPVGAAAAGGAAMEVLRSTSGVGGTRMSPRVGRSRSKVTTSRIVTSTEAISTVSTPWPNVARCRASAATAMAAPTTSTRARPWAPGW